MRARVVLPTPITPSTAIYADVPFMVMCPLSGRGTRRAARRCSGAATRFPTRSCHVALAPRLDPTPQYTLLDVEMPARHGTGVLRYNPRHVHDTFPFTRKVRHGLGGLRAAW